LLFKHKEPNATLTKQEILAAAAKHIKREITDREYHQVWNEITCFNATALYIAQQLTWCINGLVWELRAILLQCKILPCRFI
jgi:hypothetical protein